MTTYYFGMDMGVEPSGDGVVSTGTSSTGKDVEIVIDGTATVTRGQAQVIIDRIRRFICDEDTASPLTS